MQVKQCAHWRLSASNVRQWLFMDSVAVRKRAKCNPHKRVHGKSNGGRTVFADPLQATNKQPIQFHSGIIALGAHSLARADLKKSTMPLIDFIAQELDHVNTNLLKNKTFENVKGQVNSLVN